MKSEITPVANSCVAVLTVDPVTFELEWDGFTDTVADHCGGSLPISKPELLSRLDGGCREAVSLSILSPKRDEIPIVFSKSTVWQFWWSASSQSPGLFFIKCICTNGSTTFESPVTHLGYRRIELAMAEAHHRVKNTLQNVISYINLSLADRPSLDRGEIQKLTRYIQSLGSLHEILLEEVKSHGDGDGIRLDSVLIQVLELNSVNKDIVWNEIPPLHATPRHAATLSLILNELLDNAFKFGHGTTSITVSRTNQDHAALEIFNSVLEERAPDAALTEGRGIRLVRLLAKTDFSSILDLSFEGSCFKARLQFPVLT